MKENNELLEYIYKCANMGYESTTNLMRALENKENKLKKAIEDELKEYEKIVKDCKKLLKNNKIEPKNTNIMTKMSSFIGINMSVVKDNSDSAIAEMLIQGLNMGKIDMEKKLDKYSKVADKKIIKLAKDLYEFQNNSIEELKKYL